MSPLTRLVVLTGMPLAFGLLGLGAIALKASQAERFGIHQADYWNYPAHAAIGGFVMALIALFVADRGAKKP